MKTYTTYSKIAGTTYGNRQAYLSRLRAGQKLRVIREYNNQYDPDAVALYNGGDMVGYIKSTISSKISRLLALGHTVNVEVAQVTGGGSYNYGANIRIVTDAPLDPVQTNDVSRPSYNRQSDYDIDDDDAYFSSKNSHRYETRDPSEWDEEDFFWNDVYEHEHD